MIVRIAGALLLLGVPAAVIAAGHSSDPDYRIDEVRGGVFVIRGAGPNVTVAKTDAGIVVVDSKATNSEDLRVAIRKLTDQDVTYVVLTHGHDENVLGVDSLRDSGTRVVAHDATAARLRHDGEVHADLALRSRLTVHAGQEVVACHHKGRGHTDGDLVVHLAQARVLCVGGLVADGWHPKFVPGDGADLRGWIRALDELARDFDGADVVVVPGDGVSGGLELLTRQADYLRTILAFMENARRHGWSKAEALREAESLRERFREYRGDGLEHLLERAYEVAGR